MTSPKLKLNIMKLYRYYQFGRYLSTFISFVGFFIVLLKSPQRLVTILKLVGLSQTTIFSQTPFKGTCDAIEDKTIATDPGGYNSIVARCAGKVGRRKDDSDNDGGGYIDGNLRYAMDDDTLIRWYCKCHDLKPLSLHSCWSGGFLFLNYRRARPSKARSGDEEPATWQLLGSHRTRTSFLAKIDKSNDTVDMIRLYLPNGPKRREYCPWTGPLQDHGRPIETVVLPKPLKDSIIEKVKVFINDKEVLLAAGHRHQYGMLWIGPPGCGKTSLVEAIALKFGFDIYNFALGDSSLTDTELMTMYLNMGPKAIAVFDDIDRVKLGEKGITVTGLLKPLDGIARQGQTLLKILICNDRTKVPEVVLRKGRVDMESTFALTSKDQAKEIFLHCNVWKKDRTENLDLEAMAEDFARKVPESKVPPATIALYIKEALTPEDAVERVGELAADTENIL